MTSEELDVRLRDLARQHAELAQYLAGRRAESEARLARIDEQLKRRRREADERAQWNWRQSDE